MNSHLQHRIWRDLRADLQWVGCLSRQLLLSSQFSSFLTCCPILFAWTTLPSGSHDLHNWPLVYWLFLTDIKEWYCLGPREVYALALGDRGLSFPCLSMSGGQNLDYQAEIGALDESGLVQFVGFCTGMGLPVVLPKQVMQVRVQ